MSLFIAWVVFPLVLLALCTGCGLLVERAAGMRLDGALLAPLGLAALIVIAGLCTMSTGTARLATPACAIAAVAGLLLGRRRRRGRPERWALAAALGVFVVYAAPIVFSGKATFAGYIKLDDTATWLALTDRVMEHGRSLAGLAPSTYQATIGYSLAQGYPVGSLLPWGVGRALVGQDLLWLFQPYLAFLAAMLALCAWSILRSLVRVPWAAAAAAFVAAQPALLYAYAMWGGVKELVAAVCVALTAALVPQLLTAAAASPRRVVPTAVAAAATLVVLTIGGAIWLVTALVVVGALLLSQRAARPVAIRSVATFAVVGALLALPALVTANYVLDQPGGFTEQAASPAGGAAADNTAARAQAFGNLIRPLRPGQVFGIWPAGDFRTDPGHKTLTYVLMLIAVVMAAAGLALAWQRRAWPLLLYVATAAVGCFVIAAFGSPWVDAKALATASPLALLPAGAAVAMLAERRRRWGALLIALPIAGGVLWSNALAYRAVNLGPRDQLHELERIGARIKGQGPTLMTEYQPYGVRHFLRQADAEAASELRARPVALLDGSLLAKGAYADTDQFQLASLDPYRTLVLRRSPAQSRPPSDFALVSSGHWYDVWQRRPGAPRVAKHLGLGNALDPAARAPCGEVMRLAAVAGPDGRLATVFRTQPIVVQLSAAGHPPRWTDPTGADLLPGSRGSATAAFYAALPGRYSVWVGGSFRSRLEAWIDGRRIGALRAQLNVTGQYSDFGQADLAPGNHMLELRYAGPDLAPGSAGDPVPLGPVSLSLDPTAASVAYVPARDARSLCGTQLDWVEALAP